MYNYLATSKLFVISFRHISQKWRLITFSFQWKPKSSVIGKIVPYVMTFLLLLLLLLCYNFEFPLVHFLLGFFVPKVNFDLRRHYIAHTQHTLHEQSEVERGLIAYIFPLITMNVYKVHNILLSWFCFCISTQF